jgi:hypothetical protein
LVSNIKYILTPLVFHIKIKVFHSNKLTMLFTSQLAFLGSLRTGTNKSKSVAFVLQSNYNFQTQESINILKTKQNETTIMISWVAMQFIWIVDETKIWIWVCLGNAVQTAFPQILKYFFCLKWIFFYAFRSFWYAYVKNDFEKIKKLYFNTFLLEKHFELPSLPQS